MSGFKKELRNFRKLGLAEELYDEDLAWLKGVCGGSDFICKLEDQEKIRSFKFTDSLSGSPFVLRLDFQFGRAVFMEASFLDTENWAMGLPFDGEKFDYKEGDGVRAGRQSFDVDKPELLTRISRAFLQDLRDFHDFKKKCADLGVVARGLAPTILFPCSTGFHRLRLTRNGESWFLHWTVDGGVEINRNMTDYEKMAGFPVNEKVFFEKDFFDLDTKMDAFGFFMKSIADFDFEFETRHYSHPNHVFRGNVKMPSKMEFMAGLPDEFKMALVEMRR